MKWLIGIRNKFQVGALLLVVLGLILWNNLDERRQLKKLEESFAAIYTDRLLAESYLFDLSEALHTRLGLHGQFEKLGENEFQKQYADLEKSLEKSIVEYEKTKLTEKEAELFTDFKSTLTNTETFKNGIDKDAWIEENRNETLESISFLSLLSKIQTTEGEKIIKNTETILLSSRSSSKFEMTVLIVIALIIQVLIFSSQTLVSKIKQKPHLN